MITDTRIALPSARYTVEQIVEKRRHLYSVTHDNGKVERFPGVTGILSVISKPALVPWATKMGVESMANALKTRLNTKALITDEWINAITLEAKTKPEKIKDDAADLGTQAHAWFDGFIQGKDIPIHEKIRPAVTAFLKWVKESKLSLVGGDTKVASIEHGYGGALDALAIDENEQWVLLDWKTSGAVYPEYALQVSAYCQAFDETYGITPQRAVIVRFSKVEPVEFEAVEISDIKYSLSAFLAAKSLQEKMKFAHFKHEKI